MNVSSIGAAAHCLEAAIARYHRGDGAREMVRGLVALVRALLPAASDEAVGAIVNLCALEVARERVQQLETPARIIDCVEPDHERQ